MSDLPALTNGTALAPDKIKAQLATITEPVEIGETIDRFDAWVSALREVGTNTETLIDAVYSAMEARIRAVEIYDELDDDSGKRTDVTSGNPFPEVTTKQRAQAEMKVTGRAISWWRMVSERLDDSERIQLYTERRERMDEKFGIGTYLDAAKQKQREERAAKTAAEIENVLAHYYDAGAEDGGLVPNSISVASVYDLDLPPQSIDMVFTDPPYHDEYIDLYDRLGQVAAQALKPGGYCLAYAGKMFIPEIIACLGKHLEYVSIFAVFQPFSQARIMKHNIFENWRPILVFKKPGKSAIKEWAQDVVRGTRDKSHHEWQQDSEAPLQYIAAYTKPGDVVLDPFVGGGTTPWACKQIGRYFVAFDASEEAVKLSMERLANE